MVGKKTIYYDEEKIQPSISSSTGSSFLTRNIGLLVALKRVNSDEGFIVATTHLFWHPKYISFSHDFLIFLM